MKEIRDIELNTGTRHKCEISGGQQAGTGTPMVFAAGLSDEELISFLDDVAANLTARKRMGGLLKSLREQVVETEGNLTSTNEFINSVVHRQVTRLCKKPHEVDPNTESDLLGLHFDLCSAELVIRTRIGEAETKVSRSAIMHFNRSTKEINSDLQDDLIEQLDRAFAWHLSEWQ